MAEITINIPDPIHDKIKKRAEQVGNTDVGLIIANLALIFGVSIYDDSKWLKNLEGKEDKTVAW